MTAEMGSNPGTAVENIRLRTPRGTFAARAAGDPRGRLVMCLHGFPDDPGTFDALLLDLAAAGRRAVAPYLRGYAPSPCEGPFDLDVLADDLAAIGHLLSAGTPFDVVGHDMGAFVAYRSAVRHASRIRRMVTLATPHPRALLANARKSLRQAWRSKYIALFQVRGAAEWLLRRHDYAYVDRLWRAWSPGFEPPPERLRAVKQTLAASLPGPLEHYRADGFERDDGALVRVPTLSLLASRDGCTLPSMFAGQQRCFAGPFEQEAIADAGHFLHAEQPRCIARLTGSWLAASGG